MEEQEEEKVQEKKFENEKYINQSQYKKKKEETWDEENWLKRRGRKLAKVEELLLLLLGSNFKGKELEKRL